MLNRRVIVAMGTACLGLALAGRAADTPPVQGADSPDSPAWWLTATQTDAMQLTDPGEKAGVLTTLAFDWAAVNSSTNAQACADAATAAAGQITDPLGRFSALMAVAGFHDQMGQPIRMGVSLDAAQVALSGLPPNSLGVADANGRVKQFRALAFGLSEARKTIDTQGDPAQRTQGFISLAEAFSQAGDVHHADFLGAIAAAATAAALVRDAAQVQVLDSMIAQSQARGGDVDGAAVRAAAITDPSAQADALTAVAMEYASLGESPKAQDAAAQMSADAPGASDDRRAAIWLNVARVRQALGDKPAALIALDAAGSAAARLDVADRADALAAEARLRAELASPAAAAVNANDAAAAADSVTDPEDSEEVNMTVAAAEARCGLGAAALHSITLAQAAAARLPAGKQHPEGDPLPQAYLDVIQAAAAAGDLTTAQAVLQNLTDPRFKHDAVLAIAAAEVNLTQYQAAEDLVQKEGTTDAEAAVCGIISASLARGRGPTSAAQWIDRLNNPSDKIAARLAVAQVLQDKASGPRP